MGITCNMCGASTDYFDGTSTFSDIIPRTKEKQMFFFKKFHYSALGGKTKNAAV